VITRRDIDELLRRRAAPESPVLSVYLDIDQGKARNLKRGFEAALHAMLRSIEARLENGARPTFLADAERVRRFVSGLEPRGKAWIAFADDSENFFWERSIHAPIEERAWWSDEPFLRPLLETLDEYERYGVVVVDKSRARFCTVFMGEIEERGEALAEPETRRVRTTGTDHLLSESRFQHHADAHVHGHLLRVAAILEEIVARYDLDRLVLAGPVEATGRLQSLLSKRVRARVAGRIALPVDAGTSELLEETLAIERQAEREEESRLIEELIAGDGSYPVAVGLDPTVRAVGERRVWRLIYAAGLRVAGGRCARCGMLLARSEGLCDYCGGAVQPLEDLLDPMAKAVLEQGGKVETVAGEAAARLGQAGGVGAILRF
jgi:peptide chain release factor subunit 1